MLIRDQMKARRHAAALEAGAELSTRLSEACFQGRINPQKAQDFVDITQGATLLIYRKAGEAAINYLAMPDAAHAHALVDFFRTQGSVMTEGVHPLHESGRYYGSTVHMVTVPDLVVAEIAAFNQEGFTRIEMKQVNGQHQLREAVRHMSQQHRGNTP